MNPPKRAQADICLICHLKLVKRQPIIGRPHMLLKSTNLLCKDCWHDSKERKFKCYGCNKGGKYYPLLNAIYCNRCL